MKIGKETANHLPIIVGANIRKVREEVGLTQEELSQRTQLSRVTINQIEKGVRKQVKPDTLRRIANSLGKPESFFYSFGLIHENDALDYLPKPLDEVFRKVLSLSRSEQERLGLILQQILIWRETDIEG